MGRAAIEPKARSWTLSVVVLSVVAVIMVVDLYLIFMWAPTATSEHRFNLQRVLYFHVPIAWVALLGFFVVFVASILYLWKRSAHWDALAHSAAEVGLLFATLVLITGSIWAKGIWDRWWTWEPRLTTMLILWLIYVAYLMLREYAPKPRPGCSVRGRAGHRGIYRRFQSSTSRPTGGGASIPRWFTGPLSDTGSLDSTMRTVLYFSLLTFVLLFAFLVRERMSLRRVDEALRSLRYAARTVRNRI